MKQQLQDRLNQIPEKITSKEFLESQGLGNEIGFWIFDYEPTAELEVREYVSFLESMLSKKFIHFGKPDTQMFNYAFEHINQEEFKYTKDDILMVGDTLSTDILGGNKFGLKTMLVLSGNTRSDNAELWINSTGIIPDFICESILG